MIHNILNNCKDIFIDSANPRMCMISKFDFDNLFIKYTPQSA